MTGSHFQETGYIACGAYECKAVLPDTAEEQLSHLHTEHPDLAGVLYLPCDPPEEETCSSAEEDPSTPPDPDAPPVPPAD